MKNYVLFIRYHSPSRSVDTLSLERFFVKKDSSDFQLCGLATLSTLCFFALLLIPLPFSFASAENTWGGHIKYQSSLLGYEAISRDLGERAERSGVAHDFDARLNFSSRQREFTINAQGELLGAHSVISSEASPLTPLEDSRQLFDLSALLVDTKDLQMLARFDRLHLKYSSPRAVVTVGREAMSWGNGLAFHVLDLFNPFSPIAVDKEYKNGEDLALAQILFTDQSDLQILAVPRRSIAGSSLLTEESSFATKYRRRIGPIDVDMVGSAHRGQPFFGIGSVAEFSEALLRFDASLQREDGDRYLPATVVNLDRGFILGGKNLQAAIEYFHNGVGLQPDEYSTPTEQLLERVIRGEIFTIGRDYLAPILRVEALPTLNIHSIFIFNLHDESTLLQLRMTYEIAQDMVLLLGSTAPLGRRSSEFGGASQTASNQTQVDSLEWSAYARMSVYF